MPSRKMACLAGCVLLAAATMMPLAVQAAPASGAFTVAQAANRGAPPDKKDNKEEKKKEEKKGAPQHKPQPAPRQQRPPAAASHRAPPPAAQRPAPPRPAQSAPVRKPALPRPAQVAPARKPAPLRPAQTAPAQKSPSPAVRKPAAPPPARQTAPAARQKPPQASPKRRATPERRDNRRAPSSAPKRAAPAVAPRKPAPSKSAAPAITQQPAKPRDAREFIRKNNKQPRRTIKDVREQRRTTRQNGRVLVHEGDRTIVRERNRTFIRHNEDQRFAIGARDVRVGHRDGETITIIVRPDGVTIINTTDRDGHLIRRVRRNRNGREVVLIDSRLARPGGIFLNVPPPHVRMPRHRYIVDAYDVDEEEIYELLIAPPIEPIDGYYSLAQVRYNAALRDYMRRLDLDIHFGTGSWQLTPAQMDRLSRVAAALNRAIDRNPREIFLIEGHTDAVGSEEDNLSLSDRRAEAVAVALTEEFGVPPENLVTQGYGEQELKEPTQGPSRINRRVAIRRITPLIDRSTQR